VEFQVIKDIPLNLKIKLEQMASPLTIQVGYIAAPTGKRVHFFLSHDNKEPSQANHMLKFINPSLIKIEGT
jgi:hypothetical protein